MRAGQYRRTLDRISRSVADVARTVGRFLTTTDRTDADLEDAARVLHPAISAGREQAHQAAVAFIQAQAKDQGYTGTLPIPAPRDYSQESTKKALKHAVDSTKNGDLEKAVARAAVRHTEDAPRKAVEDVSTMSTEPDPATGETRAPVRWARQLSGAENCPFCVVMASRGAVYLSRQTALYDGGDKNSNSLSSDMDKFHTGCDCIAVPVFDVSKWDGNSTARYLYSKVYKEALKKYTDDEPFEAVRKYMIYDLGNEDGLKVPQLRKDEALPDTDDVPDFVSTDLLSDETKEKIEVAKSRLPETVEEWEKIRKTSGKSNLQAQRDSRASFYEDRAKEDSRNAKKWATKDPDYAQMYRDQAKENRKRAKEVRAGSDDEGPGGILDNLKQLGMDPDETKGYETDPDGKVLPTQSYLDRVDEVQAVGRSALADLRRAESDDADLQEVVARRKALREEADRLMNEYSKVERERIQYTMAKPDPVTDPDDDVDTFLEKLGATDATEDAYSARSEALKAQYVEAKTKYNAAVLDEERRRGELVRQVVGSRRQLGDPDDLHAVVGKARPNGEYGPETPATEETMRKLKSAATFFPKEWVTKMSEDRGVLYVSESPRGYFRQVNPFSPYDSDQINLSDYGEWTMGAFEDSIQKVSVHEIGHRMEKTFPAIARLEFAYLYRRATKATTGKREDRKWVKSGPKNEKGFLDEFRDAYTGKTYSEFPDTAPWEQSSWEVFTTGLEGLYGHDSRFMDADEDLQSFILGILLTV